MLADGILRITRKQLYDEIWQMSVEIREYIAAITATECDDTFVEDDGWHKAYERYEKFIRDNIGGKILFLETGVGANTPGVIKYPFMRMASANRNAVYACINPEDAFIHANLKKRSIVIREDAGRVIQRLAQMLT